MYNPRNLSNKVKHSNLEKAIQHTKPSLYVEFHAGPGQYQDKQGTYLGSSLRILNLLPDIQAILHESDKETRTKLQNNTQQFSNAKVQPAWELSKYHPDKNCFFLIDPFFAKDYNFQLLSTIDCLLANQANAFLYVPQTKKSDRDERVIQDLHYIIQSNKRKAVDLRHNARGQEYRTDHNIVVCDSTRTIANYHKKNIKAFMRKSQLALLRPMVRYL